MADMRSRAGGKWAWRVKGHWSYHVSLPWTVSLRQKENSDVLKTTVHLFQLTELDWYRATLSFNKQVSPVP